MTDTNVFHHKLVVDRYSVFRNIFCIDEAIPLKHDRFNPTEVGKSYSVSTVQISRASSVLGTPIVTRDVETSVHM